MIREQYTVQNIIPKVPFNSAVRVSEVILKQDIIKL